MKYQIALVALLATVAMAGSFRHMSTRRLMEDGWKPHYCPMTWERVHQKVDLTQTRPCNFMLRQQNLDLFQARFERIINPANKEWRQWYTLEELTDLIKPSEYTSRVVEHFLEHHGVHNFRYTLSKDILRADLSLAVMQKMFNVTFHMYRHQKTGKVVAGTFDKYSLPLLVAENVDFVSHVQGLPDLSAPKPRARAPADSQITPTVIRNRYNITPSDLVCTNSNNSHAVAEFQAQYFSQSDLDTFFSDFVPFSNDSTVAKVIGQNNPDHPGTEASLDIQYLMGVAPNATTWFYSLKSFNFYNDLITWLGELNNETQIPWVHTVSYGSQGNYPSQSYMTRSDQEYSKLGARGVSIIYASGDSGAECRQECKVMDASYPAISPHVTAIGATRFCNGQDTGAECAVKAFKSGGGMAPEGSFNTPSWQTTAVKNYFATVKNTPPPTSFSETTRGTPDFAALGDEHYQVIDNGRTVSVGGTSCSAPTFGAVITLLNDVLLNAGKPTMGYLNPNLYNWAANKPGAFFDVTVGDNENGCPPSDCSPYLNGYLDAPGWDPVTGYGTPNFDVLKSLVLDA